MSRIDEMTRSIVPQGLAEQSYITFMWITLKMWHLEQETKGGPACSFPEISVVNYYYLLWGILVTSCQTEPR